MSPYFDWLEQAQRDLKKAEINQEHEYWEWACFTAQQSAEKAVMFENMPSRRCCGRLANRLCRLT